MNFKIGAGGDVSVVLVFENQEEVEKDHELYSYLKKTEVFRGKSGEVYTKVVPMEEKTVFLGLGKRDKLTVDALRGIFYNLGKELLKFKFDSVGIEVRPFNGLPYTEAVSAIVEGLLQSEYRFDHYLSEKEPDPTLQEVYLRIDGESEEDVLQTIKETEFVIDGIFLARTLVNKRANEIYPETLAESAKEELTDTGVDVRILGKQEIEDLNMRAFLEVSKGSDREPKFIVMTYHGDPDSDKKLAFAGKGITYDSGGYSMKTSEQMETMFSDMAGAAVVIGAMKAIAKAKLKRNVVGVVAACENLVSGRSYKTGDIIQSMAGKSIEIINADAEGRLTLADALWYVTAVEKADQVVDLATLTYSCVAALGNVHSGAVTNDRAFFEKVNEASQLSGEWIWELPTHDEYRKLYKSDFADLINDDNSGAGAISAGLFLGEFVNGKPWVHLDIAGTSYTKEGRKYLPKGATGVHVKTLFNLAKIIRA